MLITIGRPLPAPNAVENMAAAFTGKPVSLPEHPPSREGGRPQKMILQNRAIRLKSGGEVALQCRVFALPEAELIWQAVTEAAIIQAIGRARGVNRSAANPVEVYIVLNDMTLPIAVDEVVQFGDLEPTKIDSMIERGLVPQWGADAAKLYPDLWPTAQAAQKAYRAPASTWNAFTRAVGHRLPAVRRRGVVHVLIGDIYKGMYDSSLPAPLPP